jgi:pyruvate dehydrogenase E1 component alpha subunit
MTAAPVREMVAAPSRLTRLADPDLRLLLLIRHVEWRLRQLFDDGLIAGTTHTCLGQEYVPVSLRPLLRDEDFVFSNHRGHGHYLARFADVERADERPALDAAAGLLAELMGRAGAPCHGVGGSQHLRRDRYLSSGVQGQSLPVAVGTALHCRDARSGALACAYIGDGTWGQGVVYEALNLAALWRLPLLVVVENNGIAQSTPTRHQLAGTIAGRAAGFGIDHTLITSLDVNQIRPVLAPLVDRVRAGRPAVVEFVTHRLGPHSKGDDTRSAAERELVARHDWYRLYGEAFAEHFGQADERMRAQVAAVSAEVAARPPSSWEPR